MVFTLYKEMHAKNKSQIIRKEENHYEEALLNILGMFVPWVKEISQWLSKMIYRKQRLNGEVEKQIKTSIYWGYR